MTSTTLFEFQKNFSVFDPSLTDSGDFISNPPANYTKDVFDIVINGITLITDIDYTVTFANYGVYVIRNLTRVLSIGQTVTFNLYTNSSKTVLANTFSTQVRPLGGTISLSKTSPYYQCDSVDVNAKLDSRATIGFHDGSSAVRIGTSFGSLSNITKENFEFVTSSIIGTPANLNIVNGVYQNSGFTEATTLQHVINVGNSFIIETTISNPTQVTGLDAFNIDGVGFARVGAGNSFYVLDPNGNEFEYPKSNYTFPIKYSVEATTTNYVIRVNDTILHNFTRSSTYSSTVGNFSTTISGPRSNPIVVAYNTPVIYHPLTQGNGRIDVNFNVGVGLSNSITNNLARVPYFTTGNVYTNTCPAFR